MIKKETKKFNSYFFFILILTILSLSRIFVEAYKNIISKSFPGRSGVLTKGLQPIWDKMMLMNQINSYLGFILSIIALVCFLNFIFYLGTKNDANIKKTSLLTISYLILMFIVGTITHYTNLVSYGNTLLLLGKSISFTLLIVIIGIVREVFMKIKKGLFQNK
ncbi:hypothetical protein [Schnuerera sp.]|uniref:hypothetical protein n=1 Tax=Schnuerera sp. TaxID=2794844 RepID=UPI002C1A42B8|nr:hypothetical protein [Schnuerera sp.]HSH35693.1 hypothetical protein [Schnuerera sp.]